MCMTLDVLSKTDFNKDSDLITEMTGWLGMRWVWEEISRIAMKLLTYPSVHLFVTKPKALVHHLYPFLWCEHEKSLNNEFKKQDFQCKKRSYSPEESIVTRQKKSLFNPNVWKLRVILLVRKVSGSVG